MGWDWNEKNKRFTGADVLFAAICSVSPKRIEWGKKDST
jgi:hypothetical protein